MMNTERMMPTPDEAEKIRGEMTAMKPVTLASLGRTLGMSAFEAARRLPEDVVSFVKGDAGERFEALWAALAEWEKATLIILHGGHVFEIEAKLSTGKTARGYYNIMGRDAVVGGHIAYESIAAAAFLRLPFMKRESLSVQFFDAEGSVAFSVYAGRSRHEIIPSVKAAFADAEMRFCTTETEDGNE